MLLSKVQKSVKVFEIVTPTPTSLKSKCEK